MDGAGDTNCLLPEQKLCRSVRRAAADGVFRLSKDKTVT